MTETQTPVRRPLRAGRRRHRHADARRPDRQRQHDERALPRRRWPPPSTGCTTSSTADGGSPASWSPARRRPSSPAATSRAWSQATKADAAEIFAMGEAVKAGLRRLELFPRPVVAAINGAALGGGFEICLATNHRIVVDDNRVEIGLPEATPRPAARRRRRHPHRPAARAPARADGRAAPGHPLQAAGRQGEGPGRRARRHPRGAGPGRQGVDQGQPGRRRRTRGTPPATRCPAARRAPRSSRRSCRPSPRCCASRPRARSTPPRGRSCPPPSRGRRSTSTPPRGSSRAT